jgi:hypothetical protein
MAAIKPRFSKEEFAKRGDAIFDKDIRPHLKNEDDDDFVAIDIETGAYEIDASELAACDRLRARVPDAQVWLRKVGSRFAHRFGGRGRPTNQ